MKINGLYLPTPDAGRQFDFYCGLLGFTPVSRSVSGFGFAAGYSEMHFLQTDGALRGGSHFAFTIPDNRIQDALVFLEAHNIPLITNEDSPLHFFDDWQAVSLYFRDPDGNIAELIIRYNLGIQSTHEPFSMKEVIGVSETGIVTEDPEECLAALREHTGITLWKESGSDFKAAGTEEGLLILVKKGRPWYPVNIPAIAAPATVYVRDFKKEFAYHNYLFTPYPPDYR